MQNTVEPIDVPTSKVLTDYSIFTDQFCVPSSSSSAGIAPETKSNQDPVVTMKRIHPTVKEDWKYAPIVQHVRREEKLIKKEVGWEKRNSEQMWMELKKRIEVIYPDYELIFNKNENQVNLYLTSIVNSANCYFCYGLVSDKFIIRQLI